MPSRSTLSDAGWAVLLAFVILGPLWFSRGYWLVGDMVFVPHQPWKAAWLGLDGALPRAVPMDALASLVTQVLPGWLLQRLVLIGGFVGGGLGAARMVGEHRWFARWGVITLFVWNPWVYERLLIGQWAILVGYFTLPWVVCAARDARDRPRRGFPVLALAVLAAAVCSPITGLMASLLVLVLIVPGSPRQVVAAGAVCILANLPWLVPSFLSEGVIPVDRASFDAFAPTAESRAGALASVLSFGGIWKSSIVPGERAEVAVVLLACLLSGAALAGLVAERHRRLVRRLSLVGVPAFLLVLLASTTLGSARLSALAQVVPPVALLRDTHRLLALFVVMLLPGFAAALTWLASQVCRGREAMAALVGLLALAPVLLLPSLLWGAAGELEPTSYPDEWHTVAADLGDDPGRIVVLPWRGGYRGFSWNQERAVLDPAPRYFPGEVLIDGRLLVGDHVIGPEERTSVAVAAALEAPEATSRRTALLALGVEWVLVEEENGVREADLPAGHTVHAGPHLRLIDLGEPASEPSERVPLVPVVVANFLAVAMAVAASGLLLARNMYAPAQHKGGTCP